MFYEGSKYFLCINSHYCSLLTTLNLFQSCIRANYYYQPSLVFGPVLGGPSEAASL